MRKKFILSTALASLGFALMAPSGYCSDPYEIEDTRLSSWYALATLSDLEINSPWYSLAGLSALEIPKIDTSTELRKLCFSSKEAADYGLTILNELFPNMKLLKNASTLSIEKTCALAKKKFTFSSPSDIKSLDCFLDAIWRNRFFFYKDENIAVIEDRHFRVKR